MSLADELAGYQRMKLGRHLLARLWACALCCLAFAANGATDTSFLLTATSSDFDRYFPTYLANGYLVTGPRGTESDLAYLAAFMDYTQEDNRTTGRHSGLERRRLQHW